MSLRRKTTILVGLVCIALASGCARPWNGAHSALESIAEGLDATDRVALIALENSDQPERARSEVVAMAADDRHAYELCVREGGADCPETHPIEHYMAIYDARMGNWQTLATVLASGRLTLLAAEDVVEVWRDTGQTPRQWNSICDQLDDFTRHVTELLVELGVDVPSAWTQGRRFLEPVCNFIVDQATD